MFSFVEICYLLGAGLLLGGIYAERNNYNYNNDN